MRLVEWFRQACEYVGEPGPRVDVVDLGGGDQRVFAHNGLSAARVVWDAQSAIAHGACLGVSDCQVMGPKAKSAGVRSHVSFQEHSGHQCSHAPGRPILHLFVSSHRPWRVGSRCHWVVVTSTAGCSLPHTVPLFVPMAVQGENAGQFDVAGSGDPGGLQSRAPA
jgi:hypothetical protein